jgi:signal transduction histidine kinase
MDSFLGVPVTVKGEAVGRLYLTNKRGAPEFSADDQALVQVFALHAGIAIENARLHEQVQRLVLAEERERISRDLHDSVIQSIYAVTLALDDVPEIAESDPATAARRVDQGIGALHGVIRDIRNFIFGLRPALLDSGDLMDGLRTLADELRRNTTMEVVVAGAPPDDLPIETVAELLAIAREGLANVARHSGATRAAIAVDVKRGDLRLEVRDDGRGFSAEAAVGSAHRGLANIRSRAERLEGMLKVDSRPGAGTRIIVTVPAR